MCHPSTAEMSDRGLVEIQALAPAVCEGIREGSAPQRMRCWGAASTALSDRSCAAVNFAMLDLSETLRRTSIDQLP